MTLRTSLGNLKTGWRNNIVPTLLSRNTTVSLQFYLISSQIACVVFHFMTEQKFSFYTLLFPIPLPQNAGKLNISFGNLNLKKNFHFIVKIIAVAHTNPMFNRAIVDKAVTI